MQVNPIATTDDTTQQAVSTAAASTDFSSYLNDATTDNSLSSIFQKAADTYGVSVNLLAAMAKQESNFQSDAVSKSGAVGVMQLMPATAAYLGCTDSYDPEQNIMAGAKYISELLDKYNGDTSLALAAYNAGSNNVDKYGGIPPFEETQNYVAKITAYMNEGVTLPDGFTTTGSSNGGSGITTADFSNLDEDTLKDILSQVFSYDDYLKFMNIFVNGLSELSASGTSLDDYLASFQNVNTATSSSEASADEVPKELTVNVASTDTDEPVTANAKGINSSAPVVSSANAETISMAGLTGDPSYYAFQSINYNSAVLNLMNQKNDVENS